LNNGLSRTKSPSATNPATTFCPNCFTLNDWLGQGTCRCQSCGHSYDPQAGSYDQGYFDCPHCCQTNINLIDTLKQSQERLKEKLVAVEYLCPCNNERTYKSPDVEDLARITEIEQTVRSLQAELTIPSPKILEGASSVRWLNHNYRYYHQIFSPRQLLAFHYLIKGIKTIPEQEYQYAFITAFTNSLEYNNMMTPYNYPHRKLHHLFNYHAMPLTTMPVENVVWGVGTEGAGTFANCYRRFMAAKKYCQKPFDRFKDLRGNVHTVTANKAKIEANLVTSFEELQQTDRAALLFCGDSSELPAIPDKSVDFVITDPPYFDSIHYSELSNFFYIWLREVIDNPYFAAEHVPTDAEAIVNQGMNKGEEEYQSLLAGVFKGCERVLKDSGQLIFTFHHGRWRAWWTVLKALTLSGFQVVDSFPAMSEYKVNPHIRNKQALDMDLVIVCQKSANTVKVASTAPAALLQRAVNDLGSIPEHSDNKLFLHFMGELLKSASSVQTGESINYDWFAEALTHFEDFLETVERPGKNDQYSIGQPRQLRLLEIDET
jgi:adenine-specific DNA methylase